MRNSVQRNAIIALLISAIFCSPALCQQNQISFSKDGLWSPRSGGAEALADDLRSYDVIRYSLDLTLAMVSEEMSGRNRITAVLRSSTDHLTLHALKLSLDSVRVDGTLRQVVIDTLAETFVVGLGGMRAVGDTVRLDISYRRLPGIARPSSRKGYYYFADVTGLPDTLAYTMSEPSDARLWMPCKDEPWDKAPAEINVTVPLTYVAASNGRLEEVHNNGNGTITWKWRETHNIAPYLMCVTVSRFTVSSLPYVRAQGDTIPLQYYVWQSDSLECARYLPTVRNMVAALTQVFGPYPFDKYGMTAIVPFGFGGMEHQTITTLNRYLKTDEKVVVHELAHQWWGNLVTCASWPDIWLNESFATYAEALWQESQGGFPALKSYMKNSLEHFAQGSWRGAVYGPESQGFGLFFDVVYSKGAWVLHTLRGVVGDSLFSRILMLYRSEFAGEAARTEDLQSVVSRVVGSDMSWFFRQWIYSPGWPIYAVALDRNASPVNVTVQQLQSEAWPTYVMPLRVRFFGGGRDTTVVIHDSLRTQSFKIALPWVPDSVTLDPDGWVLKQMGKVSTDVHQTEGVPVRSTSAELPESV